MIYDSKLTGKGDQSPSYLALEGKIAQRIRISASLESWEINYDSLL